MSTKVVLFDLMSTKAMTLHSMCINVLTRPAVFKLHLKEIQDLPSSLKKDILHILCKRGNICTTDDLMLLLNPSVKELDLSECTISDNVLKAVPICRYLQSLDLSLRRRQIRSITTGALISLFEKLPCLRIIAIPHCKEVTDEVLHVIARNCLHLEELHIPHTSVTDLGLSYLGKYLQNLSVINLLGTSISDRGIRMLVAEALAETLTEINIDKCDKITAVSSILIDKCCPNIKIFTCGALGETEESDMTLNRIRSKSKQIFWSI